MYDQIMCSLQTQCPVTHLDFLLLSFLWYCNISICICGMLLWEDNECLCVNCLQMLSWRKQALLAINVLLSPLIWILDELSRLDHFNIVIVNTLSFSLSMESLVWIGKSLLRHRLMAFLSKVPVLHQMSTFFKQICYYTFHHSSLNTWTHVHLKTFSIQMCLELGICKHSQIM